MRKTPLAIYNTILIDFNKTKLKSNTDSHIKTGLEEIIVASNKLDTRLTHFEEETIIVSAIYTHLITRIIYLRNLEFDKDKKCLALDTLEYMISIIDKVEYKNPKTKTVLNGLTSIIDTGKCNFHSFTPETYYKSMGWYYHAISCCFWFLYRISFGEDLSYFKIIKETINLGGDTDTNAAIVGGVVGVIYGIDTFPSQYLDKLITFNPLSSNVQRDCIYSPINGVIISKVISDFAQSDYNFNSIKEFGIDTTSSCLSTATLLDFILKY